MNIEVGKSYKVIVFGPKPYKAHVLAIVENQIVFKYYGRHKQRWFYDVKPDFSFILMASLPQLVDKGPLLLLSLIPNGDDS